MLPYIFRPIRLTDLDDLKSLTASMQDSIASLPDDKNLLHKRIQLSLKSFKKTVKTLGKEYYLFALEHILSCKVVGVSGIKSRIGNGNYFFVYELQKETFVHQPLNISKTVDVLHLKTIKKSPSELCSLYLTPSCRVQGLGSLLSLARYFFINIFPRRFDKELIADLKGYRDNKGLSPFWEAIGDIFFGGSLSTVDTMKSLGHKAFIRDLMPRHPIYIPLLPSKAQLTIGEVYSGTKPALHLLEKQGFKTGKWIDIFDAGPYATAKRKDIKIIQNIQKGTVGEILPSNTLSLEENFPFIISNNSIDFRACIGNMIKLSNGTFAINTDIAKALNLKKKSRFNYFKLV